jgi:hypothetical protein
MKNCRYEKSEQFGYKCISGTAFGKPASVNVDEVVEPVMNDDVPLAIVRAKLDGVPPVRVKASVREAGDFGPEIEPAVQEAEKAESEEESGWEHELDDGEDKCGKIQFDLQFLNGRLSDKHIKHKG